LKFKIVIIDEFKAVYVSGTVQDSSRRNHFSDLKRFTGMLPETPLFLFSSTLNNLRNLVINDTWSGSV
jgi:hypothetical protein